MQKQGRRSSSYVIDEETGSGDFVVVVYGSVGCLVIAVKQTPTGGFVTGCDWLAWDGYSGRKMIVLGFSYKKKSEGTRERAGKKIN